MVATSTGVRGTPGRRAAVTRRRRVSRTPSRTYARECRGTQTQIVSVVNPVMPDATRLETPSSTAPLPDSHTALHQSPSPIGAWLLMTSVCRPALDQRPARTSARTSSRAIPAARRSRRCTTPPCCSASAAAMTARWARGVDMLPPWIVTVAGDIRDGSPVDDTPLRTDPVDTRVAGSGCLSTLLCIGGTP